MVINLLLLSHSFLFQNWAWFMCTLWTRKWAFLNICPFKNFFICAAWAYFLLWAAQYSRRSSDKAAGGISKNKTSTITERTTFLTQNSQDTGGSFIFFLLSSFYTLRNANYATSIGLSLYMYVFMYVCMDGWIQRDQCLWWPLLTLTKVFQSYNPHWLSWTTVCL